MAKGTGKGGKNGGEEILCWCAMFQLFVMCGPIFLMVYYFGAQEYLLEATCTLNQDVVGPFMEQSWGPEEACYATRVTVKELSDPWSTYPNELLVLSAAESVQIDPNATQALEFSCYYSNSNSVPCSYRGPCNPGSRWKPPEKNKDQGKGKDQIAPLGCTVPDLHSYCYGAEDDGSASPEWCYDEYFNNRTRYVSFGPQEKWNQDVWLYYTGWVGTSIFLCEIAVYLCLAFEDWQGKRAKSTPARRTSLEISQPSLRRKMDAPAAVAISMDVVVKVDDGHGPPPPPGPSTVMAPSMPPSAAHRTGTAAVMEDLRSGQQLKPTPIERV
jgi:hypothetical protein